MAPYRIGLLTMSDGRPYLHQIHRKMNLSYQKAIKARLEATGMVKVIESSEPICSNEAAKREAIRLKQEGVELTIFNYAIWCYPQFTAVAANWAPGPYILFCNIHPSECGMVGMMAAAGTLDQLGHPYQRIWGNIQVDSVLQEIMSYIRASAAISRLKGNTYGNFGGRPLGMYTAVSNPDQWQRMFGIDIQNFEQYDIVKAGETISQDKVDYGRKWLEKHAKCVQYNGQNFTPAKLEAQIRSYYGLRNIIDKHHLQFLGIKAHGDLTDWYVTMDIAEAFLNDPYDWDGPHEPIIAATEGDMDGALTMQIFKYMTMQPVLFADVRHYEKSEDVWFFGNSGTAATYFAGKSADPCQNMKYVSLLPESKDYPAGGCSVHHFAMPGKMTFARLTRKLGEYRLTLVPGEIVQYSQEKMEALGNKATPQWPIAFTKLQAEAGVFLKHYPCNHIHGVYGDYLKEWKYVADILGIPVEILG